MKKTYLIPTMKTMRLPEPLMEAVVSNAEINQGEFELGAKEMNMNDDCVPVFNNKSVWDD